MDEGVTGLGPMLTTGGLMVLHMTLSVLVTMHVLLRKRDIGAAIGWIGLSWLSPFLGSALYYLFGVNRVRQRAKILGRPDLASGSDKEIYVRRAQEPILQALDRTVSRLSQRRTVSGNSIALLRNGDEAYPRMLAAINAAVSSISLSSYILRDDAAGGPMIDALIRAHRREVAVRVLIDGIGGGYFFSPAYWRLQRGGVSAARFMHSPLPWNMPFLNLRSHKKILVVDGRIGFTGGLNIGRENLVQSATANPVRDTHFEFRGPLVQQLADAFTADWSFATGGQLMASDLLPFGNSPGNAIARVITSGPDRDIEKIETAMLQAITCAQRSVLVMTPYFLPDEQLISALALAAFRGVDVDIVVPERSNHPLVDWAMRAHIDPLLKAGCRIWLNLPPFDHSKLMVVDEVWSLVGSSNWDVRSLRLNFELDVEIYDATTAATITGAIRERPARRLAAADLECRSLPVRLRDAAVRLALPYV